MTTALVVSRLFPFSDQQVHGVYQRLAMQVEALGRVGTHVHCLFLVPPQGACTAEQLSEHQERLRRLWSPALTLQVAPVVYQAASLSRWQRVGKGIYEFYEQAIARPLNNPQAVGVVRMALESQPDLILAHRLSSMSVFMKLAAELHGRPLFFDLDDIEHVAFARRLLHHPGYPRERLMLLQTPRLWAAELQAMRLATSTFVCSEPDRRYLSRFVGAARVQTVPNSARFPSLNAVDVSNPTILFIGSMANQPNAQAVDVLVQRIWPKVRAKVADARLVIIGSGAEATRAYPAKDPSVSFAGFVGDLAPWYRDARVVCCPIYHGSGTRVKIIEAAAHAKAIVSTRLGAEGLEFEDGREIMLRDTPQALADACVQLLQSASSAQRLGLAARARAAELYEHGAIVRRLERIFATAGDSARVPEPR
jgi:glycosyltransferase involved in cell wall biosynthesis